MSDDVRTILRTALSHSYFDGTISLSELKTAYHYLEEN